MKKITQELLNKYSTKEKIEWWEIIGSAIAVALIFGSAFAYFFIFVPIFQ